MGLCGRTRLSLNAARFRTPLTLRLCSSAPAHRPRAFEPKPYAMEELVAELGAAFLCAELGITLEPRLDHAQYLASWLSVLKADKKAIFAAASAASKATDYLAQLTTPL